MIDLDEYHGEFELDNLLDAAGYGEVMAAEDE